MNYYYRSSTGNYGYGAPTQMPMGSGQPYPAPMNVGMPAPMNVGMPTPAPMNVGMPAPAPTPQGPLAASGGVITPSGSVFASITEQSFVENILRMNLGKVGTFYMTYENNCDWNAKIFKGVVEAAGRDHIIISDTTTGQRIILLMVNLDFVTFDEPLNYTYPGVIGNPPQPR
ncbi:spore coat protein GerQ [Paenibacillus selenitireducens]|uniref:Spore coat protein GerQ n=1 Tax=Paenibacillus selenitireducens TaxID=1324314 RepID=A0A1T2XG35_9BACL|nr:spore coat protein GerQ [Paenibacillus selenitireducens]OPA78583.1 spore coat protein GerQ [Paenibacillus selenitireducens]